MTLALGPQRWLTLGTAGAAPIIPLPPGAVGLWYARDLAVSPRAYIPNRVALGAPKNLISASRRAFSVGYYYENPSNISIADATATAPDGSMNATVLSDVSATNWVIHLTGAPAVLPAGTYTVGISLRWRGVTGDPGYRFGDGVNLIDGVATTSWQRITQTFVSDGVTATDLYPLAIPSSGATIPNFEICDFTLYAGASDLLAGDPQAVGHMMFGNAVGQGPVSSTATKVSFNGSIGAVVQMPAAFPAITIIYIVGNSGSPTADTFNMIASIMANNWTPFGAGTALNGAHGMQWNVNRITKDQQSGYNLEPTTSRVAVAMTYDLATARVYVNGSLMTENADADTTFGLQDLWIGMLQNSFFSNYDLYGLALFDRALSASEVKSATATMLSTAGVTVPDTKAIIVDGDSISAGYLASLGYVPLGCKQLSIPAHGPNFAIPGSVVQNLIDRAPTTDARILDALTNGRDAVVHVMIGINDLANGRTPAELAADVQSLGTRWRALGAKVILGTLLPTTISGVNVQRNAYNTLLRTWVGTYCDAVADYAANPTMGPDAAASNTTYYIDGTHPTDAGHAILAPIFTGAVDAL